MTTKTSEPPEGYVCRSFGFQSLLPLMLLATVCGACTRIETNGLEAPSDRFGVVRIATSSSPLTFVHVRGFGFVPSPTGLTIGKVDEITALLKDPNDCRVIFVIESDQEMKDAVALFQAAHIDSSSICELKGIAK